MTTRRHLRAMLQHEPLWSEVSSAFGIILWAAWPYLVGINLDEQANYRFLTGLINDDYILLSAVIAGLIQLLAVTFNLKRTRVTMAAAAGLFWFTLARSIWLANPTLMGVVAHLTLGGQNMLCIALIRLRPRLSP